MAGLYVSRGGKTEVIITVGVIWLLILIYRTMIEDQMLRDELPGYAEYAAKVCYRLIPGVW